MYNLKKQGENLETKFIDIIINRINSQIIEDESNIISAIEEYIKDNFFKNENVVVVINKEKDEVFIKYSEPTNGRYKNVVSLRDFFNPNLLEKKFFKELKHFNEEKVIFEKLNDSLLKIKQEEQHSLFNYFLKRNNYILNGVLFDKLKEKNFLLFKIKVTNEKLNHFLETELDNIVIKIPKSELKTYNFKDFYIEIKNGGMPLKKTKDSAYTYYLGTLHSNKAYLKIINFIYKRFLEDNPDYKSIKFKIIESKKNYITFVSNVLIPKELIETIKINMKYFVKKNVNLYNLKKDK